MAQCTGGTMFDLAARYKHDAAQKVLARAADLWAASGREALSPDSLIAVILHIFLATWSQYGGLREEGRTLEQWLPMVGTAQQEAGAVVPQVAPATVADALNRLSTEISFAAEQWSLGNPEQPPTAQALNAVEHILFTHKLTQRPASPKLPTTVCDGK